MARNTETADGIFVSLNNFLIVRDRFIVEGRKCNETRKS